MVAAVVTAALFSAAHAPPDVLTFLDRFAFGLAASAVVWLTGGLEAAIVLHAVNNVLVFVLAGRWGRASPPSRCRDGRGLLYLLISLLSMAAYVASWPGCAGCGRRRRTAAADLRPRVLVPVPAG